MRIGIDLMGSERSPSILFEAIEQVVADCPEVNFTAFVTQAALDAILIHHPLQKSQLPRRLEFQIVADVIEMHDDPIEAIRHKKNSSLVLGMKALKKRQLDGFITTGNTGALIAGATLLLPRLPGIKRSALLATLPTEKGNVAIIDVGGNVSCKAGHLLQFAQMGAAYQKCCQGIVRPRVGLLNIGIESKKGTAEVRQAYQLLMECSDHKGMEFVGNVEGREIFQGAADVIVTNGFSGNILLKASEGVSFFILQQLKQVLKGTVPEMRDAIFQQLQQQFDYEAHQGAIVCGVDCVMVKCHGQSSPKGLYNGIKGAIGLVHSGFIQEMKQQMSEAMHPDLDSLARTWTENDKQVFE